MQPTNRRNLFNILTRENKIYFRNYEKFSLKIINSLKATNFNNNCITIIFLFLFLQRLDILCEPNLKDARVPEINMANPSMVNYAYCKTGFHAVLLSYILRYQGVVIYV